MAGIGFELKKVMDGEKNFPKVTAAIKSMFVTSGPWIISVLTILFIKFYLDINSYDKSIKDPFFSIIAYIFIFSGILSAPFINMITRYIADILYLEKDNLILPVINASILLISLISFSLGFSYFYFFTEFSNISYTIAGAFTSLSILWVLMLFVSTLKNFSLISNSFLIGMISSIFIILLTEHTLVNMLIAFTSGVLVTISILYSIFLNTYVNEKTFDFGFLFKDRYIILFITALFLNIGFWIDKFIYWFSSVYGEEPFQGLYFFTNYDIVLFVSYLTTVPALAYFTIFIETELYIKQQTYFKLIESGSYWKKINHAEIDLQKVFFKSFIRLIIFQILVSLLFIIHIQFFMEYFDWNIAIIPLFRVVLLAIFIQMLLTIVIIFLYYFDFQKEVFFISLVLFCSNVILTFISLDYSESFVGYSFLLSLLISLFYALLISIYKLRKISFYTFMSNPI